MPETLIWFLIQMEEKNINSWVPSTPMFVIFGHYYQKLSQTCLIPEFLGMVFSTSHSWATGLELRPLQTEGHVHYFDHGDAFMGAPCKCRQLPGAWGGGWTGLALPSLTCVCLCPASEFRHCPLSLWRWPSCLLSAALTTPTSHLLSELPFKSPGRCLLLLWAPADWLSGWSEECWWVWRALWRNKLYRKWVKASRRMLAVAEDTGGLGTVPPLREDRLFSLTYCHMPSYHSE